MSQDFSVTNSLPILLLANKQDDPEALSIADIKTTFNQIAMQLEARQSNVLPISAMTGLGIDASIQWILSRMILNKETLPPQFSH